MQVLKYLLMPPRILFFLMASSNVCFSICNTSVDVVYPEIRRRVINLTEKNHLFVSQFVIQFQLVFIIITDVGRLDTLGTGRQGGITGESPRLGVKYRIQVVYTAWIGSQPGTLVFSDRHEWNRILPVSGRGRREKSGPHIIVIRVKTCLFIVDSINVRRQQS